MTQNTREQPHGRKLLLEPTAWDKRSSGEAGFCERVVCWGDLHKEAAVLTAQGYVFLGMVAADERLSHGDFPIRVLFGKPGVQGLTALVYRADRFTQTYPALSSLFPEAAKFEQMIFTQFGLFGSGGAPLPAFDRSRGKYFPLRKDADGDEDLGCAPEGERAPAQMLGVALEKIGEAIARDELSRIVRFTYGETGLMRAVALAEAQEDLEGSIVSDDGALLRVAFIESERIHILGSHVAAAYAHRGAGYEAALWYMLIDQVRNLQEILCQWGVATDGIFCAGMNPKITREEKEKAIQTITALTNDWLRQWEEAESFPITGECLAAVCGQGTSVFGLRARCQGGGYDVRVAFPGRGYQLLDVEAISGVDRPVVTDFAFVQQELRMSFHLLAEVVALLLFPSAATGMRQTSAGRKSACALTQGTNEALVVFVASDGGDGLARVALWEV